MKERTFALLLFLAFVCGAEGKLALPSIIGDNMVLQQSADARLWGWADAGKDIVVKTSWGAEARTRASSNGKWTVAVETPKADGNVQSMVITDGIDSVFVGNLLIGEVWYCSGQSNMQMPVRGFANQPVEGSLDAVMAARPSRPIRMFTVGKDVSASPVDNCSGSWLTHTPENVANTSATAYFFADYLNSMLEVPVGIVVTEWGGTKVQCWMSRESLEPFGTDLSHLDMRQSLSENPNAFLQPAVLYNAMSAPILGYTYKGMLWNQGESNASEPEEYERLMQSFVKDMRRRIGLGDIPFYYVQVAPYPNYQGADKEGIAKLRVAQSHLMTQLPNCGMAVTLDIGDRLIHPRRKKEVGKRLALWALAKDYDANNIAWSGPVFSHLEPAENGKVYVIFDNAPGGVCPQETPLDGFEAAGEDGVYYPATGYVEWFSNKLALTCPQVPEIKKVRYGARPYFEATVFDGFGLPASPFVSDGGLE